MVRTEQSRRVKSFHLIGAGNRTTGIISCKWLIKHAGQTHVSGCFGFEKVRDI
jgi:hypothetical protein